MSDGLRVVARKWFVRMRHVRLIASRELNAAAHGDLINAAFVDIQARLRSVNPSMQR
jgi:hypothetical protein